VVRVLRRAKLGLARAWYVEIRSQHRPTRRDVVKVKVIVAKR
jgi:hypothetical protein